MVTRACCEKASTAKRDVSDHRATVHDDTSPSCKAIENHNCGISRQASKNKNRLEKHTRKKHIAANKQTDKSCERTTQESNPFKVQRHKEEIEGKGHKPEIAEVNHEAEKKDIIEGESVAHDNDKAFETTRENTPHSLGNEKRKDDLMGTTNELEETDDSGGQDKNNETFIWTRNEPIENMVHPAAGNESDKENREVITNEDRIYKLLKNTGQADDDDMEETPKDIDEEVKRDIDIRSESLISVCEGSSRDYQIKDIRKLHFEQTCSGCDDFSNNNHKLSPHLITVNNAAIEQCEIVC